MLLGILLIAGALAFGVTPSLRSKSCVMGLVLEAIEVTVIGSGIAGWLEKRRLGPIVLQISLCYSGLAGVCLAFVLAPTSNRPTLPPCDTYLERGWRAGRPLHSRGSADAENAYR